MPGPGPESGRPRLIKIIRPAAEAIVPRERLFRRLDEAGGAPIAWVSGPAGSGKSSLLSSYVESRGTACLWYRVDGGDADLPTFFHYLGVAGEGAGGPGATLPHLTPEYRLGIAEFSRNFFRDLFARLASPFLLVFDDLHEVPPDAPLYGALLEGLGRLPEGSRIACASRADPPAILTRLRTTREAVVLGWEELRLTPEEVAAVGRAQGLELAAGDADELRAATEGWAVGLQLLLEAGRTRPGTPLAAEGATPEELIDYFGGEIFDRLPEDTRFFLMRTSFLPSMSPPASAELSGYAEAERLLAFLYRHNYFTEKVPGPRPIYRYHALFREFLGRRARETLGREELTRLQRHASTLLARAGQFDEAAELLRVSEDWPGLERLVLDRAPVLVAQGRRGLLEQWLEALPGSWFDDRPWLSYWLGVCRLTVDPIEAGDLFTEAYDGFGCFGEDWEGRLASWAGAVEAILSGRQDFSCVDPWLSRLADLVPGPGGALPVAIDEHVSGAAFAALVLRHPTHPDLAVWEARALGRARSGADPSTAAEIFLFAVLGACYRGRVEEGREWVAEMGRALARTEAASPLARLRHRVAEAFLANTTGRFDDARAAAEAGLELASSSGVHSLDVMFLSNALRAALNGGDLDAAKVLLDRMAAADPAPQRWNDCFYHLLRAALALRRARAAAAARSAGLAVELAGSSAICYGLPAALLLRSEVEAAGGAAEEARGDLERALALAAEQGFAQVELGGHLLDAELRFRTGEDDAGREALGRALALFGELGVVPYLFDPPALAALCVRALEEGIEPDPAEALVRRCRLVPEAPPVAVERWPWPVRFYTLGRFEVVCDGELLRFSGRAQQRPLDLLKVVLARGGRGVGEGQVAEALWPDSDGDLAHQAFATTLHRLRRLLGSKEAIELQDNRLTLDPRHCWVDAWAFERLLTEARGPGGDRAIALAQRALALYGGPFLARDGEAPWAVPQRERLRSRFLEGVELLGELLTAAGRWEEATACYRRGVEVEPLMEALYRRLMICYDRQGQRAEALATYRRCRRTLGRVLGIEPSEETEALRETLQPTAEDEA